jgi:hypothetical protein
MSFILNPRITLIQFAGSNPLHPLIQQALQKRLGLIWMHIQPIQNVLFCVVVLNFPSHIHLTLFFAPHPACRIMPSGSARNRDRRETKPYTSDRNAHHDTADRKATQHSNNRPRAASHHHIHPGDKVIPGYQASCTN